MVYSIQMLQGGLILLSDVTTNAGLDTSTIVTALSILVTLLVGWQIYDHVSLRSRISYLVKKKIDERSKDIETNIRENLCDIFFLHMCHFSKNGQFEMTVIYGCLLLIEYSYLRGDTIQDKYNLVINEIREAYNSGNKISKEITDALIEALEPNLEDSKDVRELYTEVVTIHKSQEMKQ